VIKVLTGCQIESRHR